MTIKLHKPVNNSSGEKLSEFLKEITRITISDLNQN